MGWINPNSAPPGHSHARVSQAAFGKAQLIALGLRRSVKMRSLMVKTIEAVIDEEGNVRLLDPVRLADSYVSTLPEELGLTISHHHPAR